LPTPRIERVYSWQKIEILKKHLTKKWKFSLGRTDWPDSRFKWYSPSQKFFSWRRQYPPLRRNVGYSVFSAFYVVFDENEEEYYLWNRKNLITRKITAGDIAKLIARNKKLSSLSYADAIKYLPVSIQAPKGVLWPDILKLKAGRIAEDIEDIDGEHAPSSTSGGGSYQVKEFVGWTVYPAAGTAL